MAEWHLKISKASAQPCAIAKIVKTNSDQKGKTLLRLCIIPHLSWYLCRQLRQQMHISTCKHRLQNLQRWVCCCKFLVVQAWNEKNQVLNENELTIFIHIMYQEYPKQSCSWTLPSRTCIIWIAPWADKINHIMRCDWLPERASWSYLARSGLTAVFRKKNVPESHIK